MKTKEINFIVCQRFSMAKNLELKNLKVVNFYEENCCDCSSKVFYSDASKTVLESFSNPQFICLECMLGRLESGERAEFVTTPQHLLEKARITKARQSGLN